MMGREDWIENYFSSYDSSRHEVKKNDVRGFELALADANSERPLQGYLEAHPQLMCCFLRSGHGEWVIPQMRFGCEYVPDFVVGCGDSAGYHWRLVELESPTAHPALKDGQPGKSLRQAIKQIGDWRHWLEHNLRYAQSVPSRNGLGLEGISSRPFAMIIIGRRSMMNAKFNVFRKRLYEESHIEIMSYDRLCEQFRWIYDVGHAGVGNLTFEEIAQSIPMQK